MKYPYIGQCYSAMILFYAEGEGLVLGDALGLDENIKVGDKVTLHSGTNITHEYLQNTYGEVVSPEHAKFIIELAKNAGLKVCVGSPKINRAFFTFNESSMLFFYDSMEDINKGRCKQITIPLPPKADKQESSEWPQVESIVAWGSGYTGVVKSLSDEFAWVKRSNNSQYVTLYVSSLEKPKTPKEELRELLNELWDENAGDFDDFVDIAIHHVIKKPQ